MLFMGKRNKVLTDIENKLYGLPLDRDYIMENYDAERNLLY